MLLVAILAIVGVWWLAFSGQTGFADLIQLNTEMEETIPALEGVGTTVVNTGETSILVVRAVVSESIIDDKARLDQLEHQIAAVTMDSYPKISDINLISVMFFSVKGEKKWLIWDTSETRFSTPAWLPIDDGLAMAYASRAASYCSKENWDEAIADCNKAVGLDPELAMAYNNRAWACMKKGECDSAIIDLNEAIRLGANQLALL